MIAVDLPSGLHPDDGTTADDVVLPASVTVISATDIETFDLARFLDVTRDENDRDGNVRRLQVVHEGEAGLIGKVDVEQDEIREILLQELEGVLGAITNLRVHAGFFQMHREELRQLRLVFYNNISGFGSVRGGVVVGMTGRRTRFLQSNGSMSTIVADAFAGRMV